ncbi:hypothetical protein AQZ49_18990 [Novosphingobium sp. FSW06-99]|nr:hypothetical protein AQZ49_18990 [Novosphingobium sp. FSW06-99]
MIAQGWLRRGARVALALALLWLTPALVDAEPVRAENAPRQVLVMIRIAPPHRKATADYATSYGDGEDQVARRRRAKEIAARNGFDLQDNWPMPLLGVDCFVMTLPAGTTVDHAIQVLSHEANVAWAQPMEEFNGLALEGRRDPLLDAQPAQTAWHISDLHKLATGRGVSVAVIDSRIDTSHPDLAGQFSHVRDFVTPHAAQPGPAERHGTAVAGIIAARADNGIGVAGLAPESRLMALRACWQSPATPATTCNSFTLGQALEFAIEQGAQIINLSISGPPDRLLANLVQVAQHRHIAIVAAVDPHNPAASFPASLAGVISVTADAHSGMLATSYVAPGRDVPTTVPGGGWGLVNGSSFSAAHVSGLLALVRQRSGSAQIALAHNDQREINACLTLAHLAVGYRCGTDNRLALVAQAHGNN